MQFIVLTLLAMGASAPVLAEEILAPINVETKQTSPVIWKEVEGTKILSGKKNKATKTDIHPPIATDNLRQFFSQNAGITVAEQSTEPWPAFNVRGIGDPHEAQNVLILQDGLPLPMDMYGSGGQYLAPPAPMMEEIEVMAGGAALMYGPQPGGAVNFLSPRLTSETPFGGKVGVNYGSYNLMTTNNSVKGMKGKTAYWGGYYGKKGDGYQRDNADFWAHNLQLKTHTYLDNGNVFKVSVQGYDSDFGQAGGMTRNCGAVNANCWDGEGDNRKTTRMHDRLKIARAFTSLGYEQKLNTNTTLESTLWASTYKRYSNTQNTTGSTFGTIPTEDKSSNVDRNTHGLNFESRLRHDWKMGENENTLTAGVLSYNANTLQTSWTGQDRQSIRGDRTGRTQNDSRVLALFAENRFAFGKWAIVPGVRMENITVTTENFIDDRKRSETFNVFLGGLGTSYDVTTNSQAYANVSQGFKPVGFGTVLAQANPLTEVKGDLAASYVYNYELGYRGDVTRWNWDVSGYWVHYQNQIVTTGNTITNGRSARYRGVEASLTHKNVLSHNVHALDLYANANFLDAQFLKGTNNGNRTMYSPPLTVKYGAIYKHGEKWRTSLLATYLTGHYADDAESDDRYIPSYQVFDLLAEARIGQNWSVNGAINNLLDKTYYSRIMASGILPMMGRNFYAGATYKF